MPAEYAHVVLVSGGSRGIGRAVALRFARDGFPVAFCYQSDEEAAHHLEKEIAELGGRAVASKVDVTDAEAVRGWVTDTESRLGPVDMVVNSAGIIRDRPVISMSDPDWHQVIDVNLTGMFNVCRAAVFPMMKRRSGSLVNLSSVSGVYGNPAQANYSAAKAGIIGFTRALAKEVGRFQIRANVLAPGLIETDMIAGLSGKRRQDTLKAVPLGRFGTAEEVADAARFIAGAPYITGAVLQIDGGIVL